MDMVEHIAIVDASGKKLQVITLFTRTFDQISDIKVKFVTEHFFKRLVFHHISSINQTTVNGTVRN